MKKFIFASLLLMGAWNVQAQEKKTNDVVNTLKERISLFGYAQVAYNYSDKDNVESNTLDARRVILMANGRITDNWRAFFMFSCCGSPQVLELYTEYKVSPMLKVRVGQFKTQFGIENPISPTVIEAIECQAAVTNYMVGASGDKGCKLISGRDLGLLVSGDLFNNYLTYNLALMQGAGINQKDNNNQKDFVGSLTFHPIKGLDINGSFMRGTGHALAEIEHSNIAKDENYKRQRWSAGAAFKSSYIDLRAEYYAGLDKKTKSEGWYARGVGHVLPKFDIVASVDYLDKHKGLHDDVAFYDPSTRQSNYMAGVQYWFYPKCRIQMQYTRCHPHGVNSQDYNLLQAQVQVAF